jgi:hypothetical protein
MGAVPKRIAPGDSFAVSVHVTGSNFMAGTATVRLQGNGLDTTFTVVTTGRLSGAPFTLRISDSVMASSYCHVATATFTFKNASCNAVQIDDATLSGSAQFRFTPVPGLPIVLQPGDSETVTITFDPTVSGDSLATLTYRSLQYGINRSILLRGILSTPHLNEIVSISVDPSSQATVQVGQKLQMLLQLQDPVPATVPLSSVQVALDFDPDLVSITSVTDIIPLSGFTLLGRTDRADGEDLSFGWSGGAIPATTQLARIGFDTFVTDTDRTSIRVAGIAFNQFDTLFDNCVLVPQSGASVDVGISDFCGRTSLINFIKNGTILTKIVVAPDPVPSGQPSLDLSFDLAAPSTIEVSMLDVLGKPVHRSYHPETSAGAKQYQIPVAAFPSGMYVLRLRTPTQVASVPVIIKR